MEGNDAGKVSLVQITEGLEWPGYLGLPLSAWGGGEVWCLLLIIEGRAW